MATAEHEERLAARNDKLALRCGALMVERDRMAEKLAALEQRHGMLVADVNRRGELVDSIGHGGIRVLFALVLGTGDAQDAGDLARVLAHFKPNSAPGHYSELSDLVETLARNGDDYEAAAQVTDWLSAWE